MNVSLGGKSDSAARDLLRRNRLALSKIPPRWVAANRPSRAAGQEPRCLITAPSGTQVIPGFLSLLNGPAVGLGRLVGLAQSFMDGRDTQVVLQRLPDDGASDQQPPFSRHRAAASN